MSRSHVRGLDPVTVDTHLPGRLQTVAEQSPRQSILAVPSGGSTEWRQHERVRDEVQAAVDRANEAVSRSESIRAFAILDRQFSEEEGELTPTLKLRRSEIAKHFSDEIESIYV